MSVNSSKRLYGASDSDLKQSADQLLIAARKDLPKIIHYGETEENLNALESANNEMGNFPPDEFYEGDVRHATFIKNETRKTLLQHTRQITERVFFNFAHDTKMLILFNTDALSRQTDDDLVRTGRAIAYAAAEYATELAAVGIGPTILAEYSALVLRFDNELDQKKRKVLSRDIAVKNRISLGNKVYEMMINIAAKGKLCWQDDSSAHYRQYVLIHHLQKKIQIEEENIAANTVVNTSILHAKPKTRIRVYNRGNVPLSFYFAASPTDMPPASAIVLAAGGRIAKAAAYFGFAEDAQHFNIHNNRPEEGRYEVVW